MSPYSLPPGGADAIRTEAFESSLHSRVVGRIGASDAAAWRLVHITQGWAELIDGGEVYRLDAPSVLLQPWHREMRLRIAAGAMGVHVLLNANVLSNAIGHKPESPELRFMTERRAHVSLAGQPELDHAITQAMAVILAESNRASAAAGTVIEAALRIILVHLWRAQGAPEKTENTVSTTRRLMGQFNNLVEVHFRERWTVTRYAAVLGITADRLNDICHRARGRSPRQVIAARIGVEARLLLENSLHSLDQIASELGFPSTAQFNRFFKSVHGVPPGQYRRNRAERDAVTEHDERPELYSWP